MNNFLWSGMDQDQRDIVRHAWRVAIACLISVLIYRNFNLLMGYWILVTSIITIQANFGASIKRAKERLFGTILGVLVGGLSLTLFAKVPLFILISAPILIFLTVYLYSVSYIYAIFFGTILLILSLGTMSATPWQFGEYRIFDTLIGIIIGLLVAYVLPKNAKTQLHEHIATTFDKLSSYFDALTLCYQEKKIDKAVLHEQLTAINTTIVASRKIFQEFSYEPASMQTVTEALYSILLGLDLIYDKLITLDISLNQNCHQNMSVDENRRANNLIAIIKVLFRELSVALNSQQALKFNAVELNEFVSQLKIRILDVDELKQDLLSYNQQRYNVILFTSALKKLAIDLKNIAESIKQLSYSRSKM